MTIEQVKKLVPKGIAPLDSRLLKDGSMVMLRLEDVYIVNQYFDASFFFRDSKLIKVTLILNGEYKYEMTKLVFDSLVKALRSKYGQETSLETENRYIDFNKASATWMSGRTNINIETFSYADNNAFLGIVYQVESDADKL